MRLVIGLTVVKQNAAVLEGKGKEEPRMFV